MEKSSTELNTDDEMNQITNLTGELEIHSSECKAEASRKVSIDESKNTVQQLPISGGQGGVLPLKPDTPKISLPQFEYKFLLVDSFTDSTIGLYNTNKIATGVMIELVKKDILLHIDMYQKKILIGESIEENRDSLAVIKSLMYQYRSIEQSMNTFIMLDGKSINRYRIMALKVDDRDVDESNYFNF